MNKIKRNSGLLKLTLMILLSCLAQAVSLMKSSIVAGTFGASSEMDAFNFANSVATFVFSFAIAGVSTIVIPCYVKNINRKNTDAFLTVIFSIVAVVSVFIILLRSPIISIVTGRDIEFTELSGSVLVILIGANLFSIFTSVTSAYFQYIERYNIPKLLTLISQIIVVVCLFFFKGITVLQYASLVGAGIIVNSLLDLVFAVKSGWRFKPNFSIKEEETKRLIYTFIPILFSTGVYQLSLMIDSSIATRLNAGDVTVLSYANQISSMVNTLLVSNLLIFIYPKIVQDIEQGKDQKSFWEKTYLFQALICLIIAGYATIGKDGVSLLFQHGKFDEQATKNVFVLSLTYISAQQINIIRDMIYRYFYAFSDTKSATINSVIATIVNIVISLILAKFIGLFGVVIGTTLSSFVSLIAIMLRFGKKYGYEESVMRIIFQYIKTFLIMVITILAVVVTQMFLPISHKLLSILIFGSETVIFYFLLTLIFNRKLKKIASLL